MPRVRPCVGLTEPVLRGIQSIWFLNTAVCTRRLVHATWIVVPWISHEIAVLLGRDPEVAVTPSTQMPQLLYLLMVVLNIVFDGKTGRIVNPYITTQSEENPRDLIS